MRLIYFRYRPFLLLIMATLPAFPSVVVAQGKKPTVKPPAEVEQLSINQQLAIELLESLALQLKSESDKPAAAILQSRIADALWKFNEPLAREIFRWSFDAAREPTPENLTDAKRADYLRRQAAAIKGVLRRFGAHDGKEAEAWLKKLEEERATKEHATQSRPSERAELLVQLALELVKSNPEQAQRLGLLALSDRQIPESFGQLLFTLRNSNKDLSDALFREAIAMLRRNDYAYDNSLIALSNYLFAPSGAMHSDAAQTDAHLLINYFLDAAKTFIARWRQERSTGAPGVSEAGAKLYSLLAVRVMPIVARHAAERLMELQLELRELAAGLNQEQARRVEALRSAQEQQTAISNRNNYELNEQIERAERERDGQVRDVLLDSIAHRLMRQDVEQALMIAGKIDDADLRAQTQDDINLVRLQGLLNSRSYDEGRELALKLNNVALRAKLMAELANHALSKDKNVERASELLSEAYAMAVKTEDTPDKLAALLFIAQQFSRFDLGRAFETLAAVIKASNQLKTNEETPPSALARKPLPLKIKSYTVINGNEITTAEHATVDSLDFNQVAPLATRDYMQVRSLGNRIENSLLRTKFLIAICSSVLSSSRQSLP